MKITVDLPLTADQEERLKKLTEELNETSRKLGAGRADKTPAEVLAELVLFESGNMIDEKLRMLRREITRGQAKAEEEAMKNSGRRLFRVIGEEVHDFAGSPFYDSYDDALNEFWLCEEAGLDQYYRIVEVDRDGNIIDEDPEG